MALYAAIKTSSQRRLRLQWLGAASAAFLSLKERGLYR